MKETAIRLRRRGWRGPLTVILLVAVGVALVLAVLKGVFGLNLAFFRTTLTLKPTTLKLQDIQDLEFLVTAEYFGEVIGTARDFFEREEIPRAEKLAVRLAESPDPSRETMSPAETELLSALQGAIIKRSGTDPRVVNRITDRGRVAEYLRQELVNRRFVKSFAPLVLAQMLQKRDIAYLARGSVQAGYDLKDLTSESYFFCPTTKTLYLSLPVKVFSRQINPWFIYDPASNVKVKGFEIISQTNLDLEDESVFGFIKSVKEECQRRLGDDAEREGIKDQARESAERTLENMLKMLKSDVEKVRFVAKDEFERQREACPDSGKAVLSGR